MAFGVENKNLIELSAGEPKAFQWYKITMADTICADGSTGNMYLKKGTTDNLVVFFMGGGASWNQETARMPINLETTMAGQPGLYFSNMGALTDFAVFSYTGKPGIMSISDENPFSDWNMIVINYATADLHTGNNDFPYIDKHGEVKVLHHRGYQHTTACLEIARANFPKADKLLICGISGGAFAVPALAADVMGCYEEDRKSVV